MAKERWWDSEATPERELTQQGDVSLLPSAFLFFVLLPGTGMGWLGSAALSDREVSLKRERGHQDGRAGQTKKGQGAG